MVEGKRYSLTLNVPSEKGAMAELALFERDPAAYISQRELSKTQLRRAATGLVVADTSQAVKLRRHQQAAARTPRHVKDTERYLKHWLRALAGRDLRTVTKAELIRIVNRRCKPAQVAKRNKMVAALKAYTAMLKGSGQLDPAQDPGRWLEVTRASPARVARQRDLPVEALENCYAKISPLTKGSKGGRPTAEDQDQAVRDTFRLMVSYGLHHTEVQRLAANDESTAVRVLSAKGPSRAHTESEPTFAGVISFWHQRKSAWHHVSVDASSLAAVQRLRARGAAPTDGTLRKYFKAAAAKNVKVLPAKLRHSFVTLARTGGRLVRAGGAGLDLDEVAAVTGHKSTATAETHYDASVVRPLVVLPLSLSSPLDPP